MTMNKKSGIAKKAILTSIFCATALYADSLGTIQVDSTTIDDRFESKKTEVSNTTVVSGEKVDESHVENIQQILRQIPGVTSEFTTGDSLKIHLRGVENQMYMGEKPGVAVVIDGVPVFERTGAVNIDIDNIQSIKVIKGGASYLFGDDALAGAVIITTKKGAKYNNNQVNVETGSFGYTKAVARTGHSTDEYNFHVQASQRKSDGYHEDSDYEATYLNGKGQYYLSDTSDLTFGAEVSKRQKDSHGTVGGATEAKKNPESKFTGDMESRDYTRKYDVELQKFFLTYSKDLEAGNFLLNGYRYTDTTEFISGPQTKDGTNTNGTYTDDDYVYDNHYEQIQQGVKSELRTSSDTFATLLGLDVRANEYKNKNTYRVYQALVTYYPSYSVTDNFWTPGTERSNNKTEESVNAIYGEYKQGLTDNLTATANLRYDSIKMDYTDSNDNTLDKSFNVPSYRLGATYSLDDSSSLYTNYSTGFRAPTISQLFAGDVSTWGSTENNPDLKPEEAVNIEVGFRNKGSNFSYDIAVFQIDRKDFIMKTSGNYGDTDSSDKWDNVGGAIHRGLELSSFAKASDSLSFNLAYTYLDAKYTKYDNFGITMGTDTYDPITHTTTPAPILTYDVTDNTIPRTPKHRINLVADYQATDKVKVSAEGNYKSEYYADDLNEIEIEGHSTLDLQADYKTKYGNNEVYVFAKVVNVFDKQYYSTARSSSDRNEDGVFDKEDLSITVNPGRTYTAGVTVNF